MTVASTIFSKLPGLWTFCRTIPHFGTMQGKTVFSLIPTEKNLLHYREEGISTTETTGATEKFFKEYLYGISQQEMTIYFHETPKRIYHVLKLETYRCEADHQCNHDSYHGVYDFEGIDLGHFTITYIVKGPKKDHTIVTQFTKEE